MKFHHGCPPAKILLITTWKNPLFPSIERNPSDARGSNPCERT